MAKPKLSKEFVALCKKVAAKRPRTAIEHILKHGFIFGDPKKARSGRFMGRTAFTKKLKQALIAKHGPRCAIYHELFDERDLQTDHCVPFEVAGDSPDDEFAPEDFMLLCGSADRAKPWSCEHCANRLERRDPSICRSCYWAYPEGYSHIAMRPVRRLDIIWTGDEVEVYERLKKKTAELQQEIPNYVRKTIERNL